MLVELDAGHQQDNSSLLATLVSQEDTSTISPNYMPKGNEGTQRLSTFSQLQNVKGVSPENVGEEYCYLPLPGSRHIRLLRLLPHRNESAPLQCQLFDYPMLDLGEGPHMYEALSYVWGSSERPRSLFIDGQLMPITTNLYEVLLRLRSPMIERILWIDAVCIDQSSIKERGEQIQYMAEIYCKANRVIVWLGENADNSDQALNSIRMAADEENQRLSISGSDREATLAILERPWFRRIWVLQEVAAAQHIVIMCGRTRIDGYAFCLGLPSVLPYEDIPNHIRSVTYLMRGSIFRPKYKLDSSGVISLDIRSLGGLIDMYHTHEATERHDKVFALLGMSSGNPTSAGLSSNYKTPWEELMTQLVRFILGTRVLVKTWVNQQAAVMFGKGSVIGIVTSVHATKDARLGDRQRVNTKIRDTPGPPWTIQATAKPIEVGDLICHLLGAANPSVLRPCEDYFSVIMIELTLLNDDGMKNTDFREPKQPETSSIHDFLLIWDWHASEGNLPIRDYEAWLSYRVSECAQDESSGFPDKRTRLWNTALIMSDAGSSEKAVINTLQEMKKTYMRDFGEADQHTLTCMGKLALAYGRTGHLWEAEIEFWRMIWTRKDIPEGERDIISDLTNFEAMWKSEGHFQRAKNFEKIADLVKTTGGRQLTADEVIKIVRSIDQDLAVLLIERRLRRSRVARRVATEAEERLSRIREANEPPSPGGYTIKNMEGLLAEAIKKMNIEATYLLLRQEGIMVSEAMLIAAVKSEYDSVLWCLLGREKDNIQITEKVVLEAAKKSNESVLQYLLERQGDKIRITEEVVKTAVWNEERSVLMYLLGRWGDRIQITQDVVIKAAKNEQFPALKILLQERADEIKLTEDVVVAAANNREKTVLYSLLQERGSEIQITKRVVTAARANDNTLALRYILYQGKEKLKSIKD